MPIFKTLLPGRSDEHLLSGSIKSGWETWDSLESALNDLGPSNWELGTPLYGGVPGDAKVVPSWPIALILVNQSDAIEDEWERQMEKLRTEIATLHATLENSSEIGAVMTM